MQNNSLFGLQKTENQTNFNKLKTWTKSILKESKNNVMQNV